MDSTLSDKTQNLGGTLEKLSHAAGTHVGSVVTQTTEKASNYIKNTRGYVEANPLQSVAIAVATGMAVGGLLVMATRKRQ